MALCAAFVARKKIYLDVRLVRLTAQKIVPHQAVEIVRAGSASIDLIVDDFGLIAQIAPQRLSYARSLLERRSVRHINNHLELALVVERQHFHLDPLEGNKCHSGE